MLESDMVDRLMSYEQGELDFDEEVEMFEDLYTSGLLWQLQGSYQRRFHDLVQQGYMGVK